MKLPQILFSVLTAKKIQRSHTRQKAVSGGLEKAKRTVPIPEVLFSIEFTTEKVVKFQCGS
jgi:hypothetical protein